MPLGPPRGRRKRKSDFFNFFLAHNQIILNKIDSIKTNDSYQLISVDIYLDWPVSIKLGTDSRLNE